ncbi:hypothetical protein IDH44_22175 [Paenibacillus sp. IB182496]|uniref:Uncharacterized protein n=1 Tax=Paenibacillus sabuli TaxID=2772509 RepID=A0A927BXV4_9BACL|nr:YqhG family protein [Paenibacillus sabuli]MBD2847911.1 hypothetical protein [Paenibacillus sabuli]
MNTKQVHRFVQQYMESTGSRIIEKSPAHLQVKLSPQADRRLTGRTYYWSFVDRTGAEPETMTFIFVTDKPRYDKMKEEAESKPAAEPSNRTGDDQEQTQDKAAETALGRSLGFVPRGALQQARMPREDLYFGSRRLEQMFEAAAQDGSYVCLFETPQERERDPFASQAYTPWLGVNFKVSLHCDRKREEIHAIGVSLATGQCEEQFQDKLSGLRMTPRLPPNIHLARSAVTVRRAAALAEQALERKLRTYDYSWADQAASRFAEEQELVKLYYEPLLESVEEERRPEIEAQYRARAHEIDWQYRPRVTVSVINCGIFHLSGIQ